MPVTHDLALMLKARLFRGLSDPSRLAVVEALRDGEKTVSQLVVETGLSQPNTSAHLASLRDCGLVTSHRHGRFVYYTLADPQMEQMMCLAEEMLAVAGERVYTCTRLEK